MERRTKILAAFIVVGGVLLFALAYNMGGSAQENADIKKLQNAKMVIEVRRQRYALCEKEKRDLASQVVSTAAEANAKLTQHSDLLSKENQLLEKTHDELQTSTATCQEELLKEREARTGTREGNATKVILRLELEKEFLTEALSSVNKTKKATRKQLRELMTALRLENDELRRLLAEKNKPAPKTEAPKTEAPKTEAPKTEAPKT
eukprot:PhF_6_TR22481/c0_g1_i2/m.31875